MGRKLKPSIRTRTRGAGTEYFIRYTYQGRKHERAVVDEAGERITTRTGAQVEVERVAAALARGANPYPASETFDNFAAAYLEHCRADRGNAPRTVEEKGDALRYLRDWLPPGTTPRDVTPAQAVAYLRHTATKSKRWRALQRNYLAHAWAYAVAQRMAARNVFAETEYQRSERKPPATVPLDTFDEVLAVADPHVRLLARFALATWVRPSEACALDWSRVVFERHEGKRGAVRYDAFALIPDRKGKTTRPVFVDEVIARELADLLLVRAAFAALGRGEVPGPVFVNSRGGRLTYDRYYELLRKAFRQARRPWASPHKLRHTGITLALAAGADLVAVRDAAGHHSLTVTNGYAHAGRDRIRDAFRRSQAPAKVGQ